MIPRQSGRRKAQLPCALLEKLCLDCHATRLSKVIEKAAVVADEQDADARIARFIGAKSLDGAVVKLHRDRASIRETANELAFRHVDVNILAELWTVS
jgi:hypothetical protein